MLMHCWRCRLQWKEKKNYYYNADHDFFHQKNYFLLKTETHKSRSCSPLLVERLKRFTAIGRAAHFDDCIAKSQMYMLEMAFGDNTTPHWQPWAKSNNSELTINATTTDGSRHTYEVPIFQSGLSWALRLCEGSSCERVMHTWFIEEFCILRNKTFPCFPLWRNFSLNFCYILEVVHTWARKRQSGYILLVHFREIIENKSKNSIMSQ